MIIMTGLENITNSIIADANAAAEKKLSEAKMRISETESEYSAEIAHLEKLSEEKKQAAKKRAAENLESQKRSLARDKSLSLLQSVSSEIISEAKDKIKSLPDAEYFDLLKEIYKNNAENGDAEILFCEKDKKRMPDGFINELCTIGPKVVLSADNAPGEGFILRRGRVEQNCTIDAIFEDKKNELADIVAAHYKE